MKIYLIILLLLYTCSGVFSQTQNQMNIAAKSKFELADRRLNSVYQKILSEYKDDVTFTESLRVSQRLWIKFRDAEMLVKFPEKETSFYGSVFLMCWYSYKEELTMERVKRLQVWLTRTEEGDACRGSIKFK